MKLCACVSFAALVLAAAGVPAQTVYRCGNEYTRVPCAHGKSIDTGGGSATAAQRAAEARQVAASERRLAADMARDRRERESALRPAQAASLGPAKAQVEAATAASASLKPKKKAKARIRVVEPRDFVATVPRAKKDSAR